MGKLKREELDIIRPLQAEIKQLREDINNLKPEYVGDTVKDYRTGYPKTIIIQGYGTEDYYEKRDRLEKRLQRKLEEMQDRLEQIEDTLEQVEDPQARLVLRLKYRNGLTMEKIAEEIECSIKTIQRIMKKNMDF